MLPHSFLWKLLTGRIRQRSLLRLPRTSACFGPSPVELIESMRFQDFLWWSWLTSCWLPTQTWIHFCHTALADFEVEIQNVVSMPKSPHRDATKPAFYIAHNATQPSTVQSEIRVSYSGKCSLKPPACSRDEELQRFSSADADSSDITWGYLSDFTQLETLEALYYLECCPEFLLFIFDLATYVMEDPVCWSFTRKERKTVRGCTTVNRLFKKLLSLLARLSAV